MQQQADLQAERDKRIKEREESQTERTKKFASMMKDVLPKMPTDPVELCTYFDTVDSLFTSYKVPEELRAHLLIPSMTQRAKTLVGRLTQAQMADIEYIQRYLTQEYKLTSREYRSRFLDAKRNVSETHTLFVSRLKTLWSYYMKATNCDSLEKLSDLIVADRLKDTLSQPCLKYVLQAEGSKTLPASDLAATADVFDANYTPDGRYRGNQVQDLGGGSTSTQSSEESKFKYKKGSKYGFSENASNFALAQHDNSVFGDVPRCHHCGSKFHFRNVCPDLNRDDTKVKYNKQRNDKRKTKPTRVNHASANRGSTSSEEDETLSKVSASGTFARGLVIDQRVEDSPVTLCIAGQSTVDRPVDLSGYLEAEEDNAAETRSLQESASLVDDTVIPRDHSSRGPTFTPDDSANTTGHSSEESTIAGDEDRGSFTVCRSTELDDGGTGVVSRPAGEYHTEGDEMTADLISPSPAMSDDYRIAGRACGGQGSGIRCQSADCGHVAVAQLEAVDIKLDGGRTIRCLNDSGSEIAILKKDVVRDM